MIYVPPFLLRLSITSIAPYFICLLRKATNSMALLTSTPSPTAASSDPPPWWLYRKSPAEASNNLCQKPEISKKQEIIPFSDHNNQALPADNYDKGFHKYSSQLAGSDQYFSPKKKPPMVVSRKRPAMLVIPAAGHEYFVEKAKRKEDAEEFVEVIKGRDFFLASKKGRREYQVMEDRHAVILDISGDPKQAFFVVIDGHGGNAAADYISENLGKNIVNELVHVEGEKGAADQSNHGQQIEAALRQGYSFTDKQFLALQNVNGGACAAGVLLKDGEVHVANVGDCKVVMSKNGKAITLTNEHRLSCREDERARIENSGGFLHCHNGVWRVNGSIAVSRAFGDRHLKDWIICEPHILDLPLTSDCHFLILASDGLWDKVSEQEAVDVALSSINNLLDSCIKLVNLSSSRGNNDDITVMVINLDNFKKH